MQSGGDGTIRQVKNWKSISQGQEEVGQEKEIKGQNHVVRAGKDNMSCL